MRRQGARVGAVAILLRASWASPAWAGRLAPSTEYLMRGFVRHESLLFQSSIAWTFCGSQGSPIAVPGPYPIVPGINRTTALTGRSALYLCRLVHCFGDCVPPTTPVR